MEQEIMNVAVCVTCRAAGAAPDEVVGAEFLRAFQAKLQRHPQLKEQVRLQPVECMAVCKRPCTVAVSAPDKWTYMIGDLDVNADIDALLEYLVAYHASPSGTPALKERPTAIRRGTIARLAPSTS